MKAQDVRIMAALLEEHRRLLGTHETLSNDWRDGWYIEVRWTLDHRITLSSRASEIAYLGCRDAVADAIADIEAELATFGLTQIEHYPQTKALQKGERP